MPTLPKDGQLGPITAREVARRHGMTVAEAEDVAAAAGVNMYEYPFTYLTRSGAESFLAELYRRKGVKVLQRERRRAKK